MAAGVVLLAGLVLLTVAWRTSSIVTVLEVAAALAVGLGLVVAFGGRRDRGVGRPPSGSAPEPVDVQTHCPLVERTAETLAALDRIEHRRLELVGRWPKVVVGPTGVVLIDVCTAVPDGDEAATPSASGAPVGRAAPGQLSDPSACAGRRRLQAAAPMVAATLHAEGVVTVDGARPVPVRAVLVGPEGTPVEEGVGAEVGTTSVERLGEILARGPVLRMRTVDRAFAALSRAPSLVPPPDPDGRLTRVS